MSEVSSDAIQLVLTSAPHNFASRDGLPGKLEDYLRFLAGVWDECVRVLWSGGRLALHVANNLQSPYVPIHSIIAQQLMDRGLSMRGEIVWHKRNTDKLGWGSWMSPRDPRFRNAHDYLLLFSKGPWRSGPRVPGSAPDITPKEFLEGTHSVWEVSESREGLRRAVKLLSFPGDIILDPFAREGEACLAAAVQGRHYIGYEADRTLFKRAEERLAGRAGGLF